MNAPDEQGEPGFGQLLAANVKVVAVVLVLIGLAYGVWRGAAALFPEIGWLQG